MDDIDTIVLKSGRAVYASMGALGITPTLHITNGACTAGELEAVEQSADAPYQEPPLTIDERHEIASIMVERWKVWAGVLEWPDDAIQEIP